MLKRLTIEHYRGFFDEQLIDFAIPNQKAGSGLTLIVGPNNTGKTAVIESLQINITSQFKHSERHSEKPPTITIENDKGIVVTFTGSKDESKVKTSTKTRNHGIHFDIIPSQRTWDAYFDGKMTQEELIDKSAKQSVRNSAAIELGKYLSSIDTDKDKKSKMNEYMRKIIPNFSDWAIDADARGNYIKYTTNKASHETSMLGDGIISIFRICAHLILDEKDKYRVLLIDEPEQSLHPTAQKSLSRLISEISKNRQVILCTHSPHFVNWTDFENGAKFVRLNKANDIQCNVFPLNNKSDYSDFIGKNYEDIEKPQILDYVAKEILFSENVLFVEGQEDVGLLRRWLRDNHTNINFEIFGYGVGSYSNFKLFLELSRDLGLSKVAVLYDNGNDSSKSYNDLKNQFSSLHYHFEILPTEDIREKYDKKTGKMLKQGCFQKNGELKLEWKKDFVEIMGKIVMYFK